jgi:hypothetical protein
MHLFLFSHGNFLSEQIGTIHNAQFTMHNAQLRAKRNKSNDRGVYKRIAASHCEEREARRGNLYQTRNAPFYTVARSPVSPVESF